MLGTPILGDPRYLSRVSRGGALDEMHLFASEVLLPSRPGAARRGPFPRRLPLPVQGDRDPIRARTGHGGTTARPPYTAGRPGEPLRIAAPEPAHFEARLAFVVGGEAIYAPLDLPSAMRHTEQKGGHEEDFTVRG